MAVRPRLVLGLVVEERRVCQVTGVAGDHGRGHIGGQGHVRRDCSLRGWRKAFKHFLSPDNHLGLEQVKNHLYSS